MKRHRCLRLSILSCFAALALLVASKGAFVHADHHQYRTGEEGAAAAVDDQSASEREGNESIAACSAVRYGKQPQSAVREEGKEVPGGGAGHGENEPGVVPPPNPDGPTLVDLGLYIHQIPEISELENSFVVNAFMDLVWCDPRLAYDPGHGTAPQIYLEQAAVEKLAKIWWPDLTFPHEVNPRDAEHQELIINSDGTVEYEEKFTVRLEAHFDLHQFPFDHQELELEIESFPWPQHMLQLHRETHKIGFGEKFDLPEWHRAGFKTEIRSVKEIRDRDTFSEFLMTVAVERQYGFYLWKVLLPLILLVIISWVVFWMTEIEIHDRMGISFTGLLTVVAYQFIATGNLPAISYFTLMDGIIGTSFAVMILSVFENLVVHVLITHDKKSAAVRLDRTCRWLFPLVYVAALVVLSQVYLGLQ